MDSTRSAERRASEHFAQGRPASRVLDGDSWCHWSNSLSAAAWGPAVAADQHHQEPGDEGVAPDACVHEVRHCVRSWHSLHMARTLLSTRMPSAVLLCTCQPSPSWCGHLSPACPQTSIVHSHCPPARSYSFSRVTGLRKYIPIGRPLQLPSRSLDRATRSSAVACSAATSC